MIQCDYFIIGSGIAGIGAYYKLSGKKVIVDRNPSRYKIGESHLPSLLSLDYGLLSLIPKIESMKSFNRKLGSVFCDLTKENSWVEHATPLGEAYSFHANRNELERLFIRQLGVPVTQENIVKIDFDKSIVRTDKNTYQVGKYIIDCSGPAMVVARALNIVKPLPEFQGMSAKWGYWKMLKSNNKNKWIDWTVIKRIKDNAWMWQIPLYHGQILSSGIIVNGGQLSDEEYQSLSVQHNSEQYDLKPLFCETSPRSYFNKIYSRRNYANISERAAGNNWVLAGDAYCFADPIYSVGTGVAMSEAICLARHLNTNDGVLDKAWYDKKCRQLVEYVLQGIDTWYKRKIFDSKVRTEINEGILKGKYFKNFVDSVTAADNAAYLQTRMNGVFTFETPEIDIEQYPNKIYFFSRRKLSIDGDSRFKIALNGKAAITVASDAVGRLFNEHIFGKNMTFCDLYLLCEKHLEKKSDKGIFWKIIKQIEESSIDAPEARARLFFHPEKLYIQDGELTIQDKARTWRIQNPKIVVFFDALRGKIYAFTAILKKAKKQFSGNPRTFNAVESMLKICIMNKTFGKNIQI